MTFTDIVIPNIGEECRCVLEKRVQFALLDPLIVNQRTPVTLAGMV